MSDFHLVVLAPFAVCGAWVIGFTMGVVFGWKLRRTGRGRDRSGRATDA